MDANKRRMYRSLICHGRERDGEPVTPEELQYRKDVHGIMMIFGMVVMMLVVAIVILVLWAMPARAHDHGDVVVSRWLQTLMRPDQPTYSCCGEGDHYFADTLITRDGKVYAVITDDRDDKQFNRAHVPVGTEVEVPNSKLKYDAGNPTGHAVIFLNVNKQTICYVQGTGI